MAEERSAERLDHGRPAIWMEHLLSVKARQQPLRLLGYSEERASVLVPEEEKRPGTAGCSLWLGSASPF